VHAVVAVVVVTPALLTDALGAWRILQIAFGLSVSPGIVGDIVIAAALLPP